MLTLIRGLPGSGKSTLAKELAGDYSAHYEADMFFMVNGVYQFDASKIKDAHNWCQDKTRETLSTNLQDVIVSNTFSQMWEMHPYIDMVKGTSHSIRVIECQGNYGNIHNVPDEVIERMRQRWERYQPS